MIASRGYGEAGSLPYNSITEKWKEVDWEALDLTKEVNRILARGVLAELEMYRRQLIEADRRGHCVLTRLPRFQCDGCRRNSSDHSHQFLNAELLWTDHFLGRLTSLVEGDKKVRHKRS